MILFHLVCLFAFI